jgi:hypothetical protein
VIEALLRHTASPGANERSPQCRLAIALALAMPQWHMADAEFRYEIDTMPRARGLPKTGGRQKGVANQRTRAIAEAAMADGVTPLEYMLAVLRDETVEPERRDEMAKAAAPYLHPRVAAIEAKLSVAVDHETALDQLEASPLGAATGA